MRDRVMEAMAELQEKSPFVCSSCDHHEIAGLGGLAKMNEGTGLRDRFTEAVMESAEHSAFVCESCG